MHHVFVMFFSTQSALNEENGQFQAAVGVPHVGLIVRGAWCRDRWDKFGSVQGSYQNSKKPKVMRGHVVLKRGSEIFTWDFEETSLWFDNT